MNRRRRGSFHGLGPLACSVSELTSETTNPFGHWYDSLDAGSVH